MKHLIKGLLLLSLILLPTFAHPKSVGYLYKALSIEGCYVRYSVAKNDTAYYIVVMVESDNLQFMNEPAMKVRKFKDDVLTFSGAIVSNGVTDGFVVGRHVLTDAYSIAQFRVMPEEFEMLKSGVEKIRLTMIPENHERTFKKDKIGKKLYKFYLDAKSQDNF